MPIRGIVHEGEISHLANKEIPQMVDAFGG
jgi:hypothetical protein